MAKKLHPDVNDGEDFYSEKFKQIDEAYRELIDPDKRRRHDIYLGLHEDHFSNDNVESEPFEKDSPPQKSEYETRQPRSSSLFTNIGNIYRYIGSVKINYWLLLLIAIGSFTIADLYSGGHITKKVLANLFEKNSEVLILEDEVSSDRLEQTTSISKPTYCLDCQGQAVFADINSLEGVYDIGSTKRIETQIGKIYIVSRGDNSLNVFGYFNRGAPGYNQGEMLFSIKTESNTLELGKEYDLSFYEDKFRIIFHSTFLAIKRLTENNTLFGYGVEVDGLYTRTSNEKPNLLYGNTGEVLNLRDTIPQYFLIAN